MLTLTLREEMLKKKTDLIVFTGRVNFRKIIREDFRGVKNEENKSKRVYSYIISFEVIIPGYEKLKKFYDLYSRSEKLREFASLGSIEVFLKKINFMKGDFDQLKGSIVFDKKS